MITVPELVGEALRSFLRHIGSARISRAIEFTRFPVPEPDDQDDEDGSLARAANLIGQLGDPNHLRKANALYCEF